MILVSTEAVSFELPKFPLVHRLWVALHFFLLIFYFIIISHVCSLNVQNVLPLAPFVGIKVILCFQCAELLKHVVSKGNHGSFIYISAV